jgi:hypothetical protein
MNPRKEARGRECTIRLPGICNHDPETTVYAHLRMSGITGMGYKPSGGKYEPGAFACSACHDVVDRRDRWTYIDPTVLELALYKGVIRTEKILFDEGKMGYKGVN